MNEINTNTVRKLRADASNRRQALGLSQSAFAGVSGLTMSQLFRYEHPEQDWPVKNGTAVTYEVAMVKLNEAADAIKDIFNDLGADTDAKLALQTIVQRLS